MRNDITMSDATTSVRFAPDVGVPPRPDESSAAGSAAHSSRGQAHSSRGQARGRRQLGAVVEAVSVVSIAAGCTFLLSNHAAAVLVPGLTAALLLLEIAALPAYERFDSLRPLRRVFSRVALALLVATSAGALAAADLRYALMAVGVVLAAPTAMRGLRRLWPTSRTTILVGDRVAVSHLIAQWEPRPEVRITGVCLCGPDDDSKQPDHVFGFPVVGRLAQAAEIARGQAVDQVVVAPGPVPTAYDVRRLSWALEDSDVELAVAAEVHGAVPRRIEPRLFGRRLVLSVRPTRRPEVSLLVKSLFDRVLAFTLLVLTLPLLLSFVVTVRLDSRGPGFFRQTRVGRGGRHFTMIKFRTMTTDAEERRADLLTLNEGAGPLFKLIRDPRITRIGRLLRRTSLDELPQLWNVVRGDMSLVGPRPALPRETDQYDDWVRRRLSVKPGMTGLWQVSGRSRLGWNDAVRLDLDYVDNWTLGGDLSIAGRTVNAVLRRDGAC